MSSFSFSFFGENSNGKANDLNGTLSNTNSAFGLIDLPRPLSSAPPNPGNAISIAAFETPSINVLPISPSFPPNPLNPLILLLDQPYLYQYYHKKLCNQI